MNYVKKKIYTNIRKNLLKDIKVYEKFNNTNSQHKKSNL